MDAIIIIIIILIHSSIFDFEFHYKFCVIGVSYFLYYCSMNWFLLMIFMIYDAIIFVMKF